MSRLNCRSLSVSFSQISSPTLNTSQLIRIPTDREGDLCVCVEVGVKKTHRSLGCLSTLYHLTSTGQHKHFGMSEDLTELVQAVVLIMSQNAFGTHSPPNVTLKHLLQFLGLEFGSLKTSKFSPNVIRNLQKLKY